MYQSLHIGCNNYEKVKSKSFIDVKESHEDVKNYSNFFKKEQNYNLVTPITDKTTE